ncbi:MAG TPA: hypothetical protein VF591_21050 [Pyrinomonadaceae bacterium]|jgi:hypothetical protein
MGRIEWLTWVSRYGNPRTRWLNLKGFLAFEVYRLGCTLSGYRVAHWLDEAPPRPAGKYLRVVRPAPLAVRMLDRLFPFGEEAHTDYMPLTREASEEARQAGGRVKAVEMSYRLGVESSE